MVVTEGTFGVCFVYSDRTEHTLGIRCSTHGCLQETLSAQTSADLHRRGEREQCRPGLNYARSYKQLNGATCADCSEAATLKTFS